MMLALLLLQHKRMAMGLLLVESVRAALAVARVLEMLLCPLRSAGATLCVVPRTLVLSMVTAMVLIMMVLMQLLPMLHADVGEARLQRRAAVRVWMPSLLIGSGVCCSNASCACDSIRSSSGCVLNACGL